jgi:hypothetical protein
MEEHRACATSVEHFVHTPTCLSQAPWLGQPNSCELQWVSVATVASPRAKLVEPRAGCFRLRAGPPCRFEPTVRIQTSKINSKFIYGPKIMKSIMLFFLIQDLSKKNIKLNSRT